MATPDDLDPDFRGPAPGWEPGDPVQGGRYTPWQTYANSSTANLDQLARARVRPRTGPYAQGLLMHQLGERTAAARRAAERAVESVRATWAAWGLTTGQAPWITRKNLGRGGGLYTLQDLVRNVVRANKVVADAQQKAKAPAIKPAPKLSPKLASLSRGLRAVRLTPGGALGPPPLTDLWAQKVSEESWKQRKRRLGLPLSTPGRTGANATRPAGNVYALPGRTGAKSTRPAGTATATPTAPRKAGGQLGKPAVEGGIYGEMDRGMQGAAGKGVASEKGTKSASKSTTTKQSGSLKLPGNVLQFPKWAQQGLGVLSRVRVGLRTPTRTRMPAGLRARAPTSARTSTGLPLTLLNGVGVGSQVQQAKCDCPKPKRQQQKRSPGCTNPLISRSEKDGILTIKRKLQCPPSKSKSPLARRAPTATSSPDPLSSIPGAALRFPWG